LNSLCIIAGSEKIAWSSLSFDDSCAAIRDKVYYTYPDKAESQDVLKSKIEEASDIRVLVQSHDYTLIPDGLDLGASELPGMDLIKVEKL